jgi:hypothetical protein
MSPRVHDTHPAGLDRPAAPVGRPIAWVDGRVVPAGDATVPLTDDGFLRGDAIFEAVLVRGAAPSTCSPTSIACGARRRRSTCGCRSSARS